VDQWRRYVGWLRAATALRVRRRLRMPDSTAPREARKERKLESLLPPDVRKCIHLTRQGKVGLRVKWINTPRRSAFKQVLDAGSKANALSRRSGVVGRGPHRGAQDIYRLCERVFEAVDLTASPRAAPAGRWSSTSRRSFRVARRVQVRFASRDRASSRSSPNKRSTVSTCNNSGPRSKGDTRATASGSRAGQPSCMGLPGESSACTAAGATDARRRWAERSVSVWIRKEVQEVQRVT
jgi:hypothetical protein